MDSLGGDAIALLQYLLPGFLAAWVFYSLTSFPKPSQFERTVQALIFTLIVEVGVYFEKPLVFLVWTDMDWDAEAQLLASALTAVTIGIAFAYCANTDVFFGFMRRAKLTREMSFPSQWYAAFALHEGASVVLHLKNRRRLSGWPQIWPTDPKSGHFVIAQPKWPIADGETFEDNSSVVIPVEEVLWVELIRKPGIHAES